MESLFSLENPIMLGIFKIMNCILICVLWIICCIPIFTIGTSTTALYYTVQKAIKNERGYLISGFFRSFRENFKQTTPVWIVMMIIALIFWLDIKIMQSVVNNGYTWGNIYIVFEVLIFVEIVYAIYVFSYFARFKNSTKAVLKNSSILAVKHMGSTVAISLILLFTTIIIYILPVAVFIMPIIGIWFISMILEKIYYQYMSEEDKLQEDLRNMKYHGR